MRAPKRLPACTQCGYWLRGLKGDICPECGGAIDWAKAQSGRRQSVGVGAATWAVLGLASGIISAAASFLGPGVFILPGLVFGVVVVYVLVSAAGHGTQRRIAGVAASITAYLGAMGLLMLMGPLDDSAFWFVTVMALIGGSGASLLDIFLRPIENHTAPLKRLPIVASTGAIMAALPALARSVLEAFFSGGDAAYLIWFCGTFLTWQTGVAIALALYSPRSRWATAAPESSQSPPDHP